MSFSEEFCFFYFFFFFLHNVAVWWRQWWHDTKKEDIFVFLDVCRTDVSNNEDAEGKTLSYNHLLGGLAAQLKGFN